MPTDSSCDLRSAISKPVVPLVQGFAHDLNNLFTSMLAHLGIIKSHIADFQEALMHEESARMATMKAIELTNLLSRLSNGYEYDFEIQPLQKPILDAIKVSRGFMGCNIECNLADTTLPIYMNSVCLTNVFMNLIINASYAMEHKGTIFISCLPSQSNGEQSTFSSASITIRDQGKGIPESDIDKIFAPFFSSRIDGTGLGLAMVRSVIEQHHGHIDVCSEEAKGTTFLITLPLTATQVKNVSAANMNDSHCDIRNGL